MGILLLTLAMLFLLAFCIAWIFCTCWDATLLLMRFLRDGADDISIRFFELYAGAGEIPKDLAPTKAFYLMLDFVWCMFISSNASKDDPGTFLNDDSPILCSLYGTNSGETSLSLMFALLADGLKEWC